MKNNLINEIKRIKSLSNINELQNVNEENYLEKLKDLISTASDNIKNNDTFKELMSFFDSLSSDTTTSSGNDEVISGNYSAKDTKNAYDALHSFQSRKSDKFGGRINTKVQEAISKYKESKGVDSVDIKKVDVDIDPNTLTVNWKVIIGPSTDGYTYEEFDSRGSAGGGESAVDGQLSSMHSNHTGKPKLVYHLNKTIPMCFDSNGTKKTGGCGGNINIQQKFFKYGKEI